MVQLLTLFLLTSNGNKAFLNKDGFNIENGIKQISNIEINFIKDIKTVFQSIHQTHLPTEIPKSTLTQILKDVKTESDTIATFDDLDKTFGILLRQRCTKEGFNFDSADISNIEKGIWDLISNNKTLAKEIKTIIENIRYDNSKLFASINKKITLEPKKDTDPTPPFTIKSIIELAWGLSMNFSHEESQKTLGGKFYDSISSMLRRFSLEKLDQTKPISGMQEKNEKFVTNMTMALVKTARNLGFVRDIHTRFLDSKEKELEKRNKFLNDLSSTTSFSKEGLTSKIGSFVGTGTIASWLVPNDPVIYPEDKIERLEKLLSIAPDGNKTDVFTELFTKVMQSPDAITRPTEPLLNDAVIFTIVGIIGLFSVIIIFKVFNNMMSRKYSKQIKNQQTQYWGNHFIPEASEHLYFFYKDIDCLLQNHYGKEIQVRMNNEFQKCINEYGDITSKNTLTSHLAKISKEDKKILFFIQNQVLPHYHIENKIVDTH